METISIQKTSMTTAPNNDINNKAPNSRSFISLENNHQNGYAEKIITINSNPKSRILRSIVKEHNNVNVVAKAINPIIFNKYMTALLRSNIFKPIH